MKALHCVFLQHCNPYRPPSGAGMQSSPCHVAALQQHWLTCAIDDWAGHILGDLQTAHPADPKHSALLAQQHHTRPLVCQKSCSISRPTQPRW